MHTSDSVSANWISSHLPAVLLANAIFSSVSGIGFVLVPATAATFVGLLRPEDVRGIGVQLLVFAAIVAWIRHRLPHSRRWVRAIIGGDCLWVVGSIVLVLARPAGLTGAGIWAILVVATIVATFAAAQAMALKDR